jgi:hypothetical protein
MKKSMPVGNIRIGIHGTKLNLNFCAIISVFVL